MPDNSQRPSDRKLTLIAPVAILVVVGMLVVGATLLKPDPDDSPPPTKVVEPPPPVIAAPVLPPPLTRSDILARMAVAASVVAGGEAPTGREPIINRPFRLRIAFGCGGQRSGPDGRQAYVQLDPARHTLKLVAQPQTWTDQPIIRQIPAAAGIEAVEGFWIPRPWTESEACPPDQSPETPIPASPDKAADAAPVTPPTGTAGLARLFTEGGSRVFRRDGRPYSFIRKLPEGEVAPAAEGYRLVLEGRVTGFPDGRAVHCRSESPDRRPVCLMAVEFDRVAFEDGATGAVLAEWRD